MGHLPTNIHIWFLRHGRTHFNYEKCEYDEFIEMLCNGQNTPLVPNDSEIDFNSLPKVVDFVGYSQYTRAFETAKLLCTKIYVKNMEEMSSLNEVNFSKDIISKSEYESLAQSRSTILKRWGSNEKKYGESFKDSLGRVREIESFLSKRQEKTIVLVTHGWFLRLLELYFVQGNRTPTIDDLLDITPVKLGHCVTATIPREYHDELQMNIETAGKAARRHLAPATL